MTRRWTRENVAVTLVALGHGVLGLALLPAPLFAKYSQAAHMLRQGTLPAELAADFSPLYLLLNGAIGAAGVRALQSAAGAVLVALVFAYARDLFGRAAGMLAATLAAIALPLLIYEATLEPDLWVASLGFASCFCLWRGPSSLRWLTAAGALGGLGAAMRPSGLLFVGGAAVALFAINRKSGRAAGALSLVAAFAASALVAAALPVAVLRSLVGSQPGATMSAGLVLHIGNRPEGTGLGAQPPAFIKVTELQQASPEHPDHAHALYRQIARAARGDQVSAAASETYWVQKAAAFGRREPGAFAALLGRKLAMLLLGPEGHDLVEARDAERRLAPWPLAGARPLAILGLLGLIVAAVRRQRVGLLWLAFGSVIGVALIFYVVSRYRLALVPMLCVGCAALAHELKEAISDRRRLVLPVALAAACLASPWLWPFLEHSGRLTERASPQFGAAVTAALAEGDLRGATEAFVQMQAANPYTARLRDVRGIPFESSELAARSLARSLERFGEEAPADTFYAAVLAARAGHCDDAEKAAAVASRAGFSSAVFDWSLDPELLIAGCRLELGDRRGALQSTLRSLHRRPGTLDGLAMAVAALTAEGQDAAPFAAELAELHDPGSAAYALAKAFNAWGLWEAALSSAQAALRVLPQAAIADYEQARALMGLHRDEEAFAAYGRALSLFPAHPFAASPFDAVVAARVQQLPSDPAVLAVAADHELRRGRVTSAKELARRAVEASAGAPSAALQATVQYLGRLRP